MTQNLDAELFREIAAAESAERVGELIAAGADVNYHDAQTGRHCLHEAVVSGMTPVVAMLVEAGADVNRYDAEGYAPPASRHHAGRPQPGIADADR